MSVLLAGDRQGQILTLANVDEVMDGFDLPAGSVLRKVKADIHVISTAAALERDTAVGYAVAMFLIELDDPDTAISYDTLWDRKVVKYTDVDTIDLNTASGDVSPFWTPGEASFEELYEMGDQPLRLFSRKKVLTFADPGTSGLKFQPSETPFEPQWFGADRFSIRLNRPIRTRRPACVVMAIASPDWGDTSTGRAILTENEWGRIQYVEQTLDQALIDQLNLVEAGAETPWEDASVLLRKHLAPNVLEETAGAFVNDTFNVFWTMQFEHSVPGHRSYGRVDLTPG